MRISILGKGGSGKTTITTTLINYVKDKVPNLLAIDGDVNVHLGTCLGISTKPLALGDRYEEVFTYLFQNRKDTNLPKIGTVPPSDDSTFVRINKTDPFIKRFAVNNDSVFLLNIDTYQETEVGINCFHGRIHTLELLLHYLLDSPQDMVFVDSTAGIDTVATSMHFSSDLYIFVVEPTSKSIGVYTDYKAIIQPLIDSGDVCLKVVVNKLYDATDMEFINNYIAKEDILTSFSYSKSIKRSEQGNRDESQLFLKENAPALETLWGYVSARKPRDWDRYLTLLRELFNKQMHGFTGGYYKGEVASLLNNSFRYSNKL